MRSLILIGFVVGLPNAWAAKCPNIAGTFTIDTAYGHDTTTIKQRACKSISFSQAVAINEKKTLKTNHRYVLDGQWRAAKKIEDQTSVKSSARMTDVGVEIIQRAKKGEPKEEKVILSLDPDRNLVIQKAIPEVWQRSKKR